MLVSLSSVPPLTLGEGGCSTCDAVERRGVIRTVWSKDSNGSGYALVKSVGGGEVQD